MTSSVANAGGEAKHSSTSAGSGCAPCGGSSAPSRSYSGSTSSRSKCGYFRAATSHRSAHGSRPAWRSCSPAQCSGNSNGCSSASGSSSPPGRSPCLSVGITQGRAVVLTGGEVHQATKVVLPRRDEPDAGASTVLGTVLAFLRARAAIKVARVARGSARAPTPIGVASGAVAVTGRATPSTSGGATRPLRLAVPARRVIRPSLLGPSTAGRAPRPIAPCRAERAQEGGAVRVPVGQAARAATVPVGARHEPGRPTAALQRIAQDGASRARRRVGRALIVDAKDASRVVEAGVAALPHLDGATRVAATHDGVGAPSRRATRAPGKPSSACGAAARASATGRTPSGVACPSLGPPASASRPPARP